MTEQNHLLSRLMRNLGPTQILVIDIIAASGARSASQLAESWPTLLTESSAGAALRRLKSRGLVDFAGLEWESWRRTYELTALGARIAARPRKVMSDA